MKRSISTRILLVLSMLAMLMVPAMSFAADSTHLASTSVLGTDIQKGAAGGVPVGTVITWPVGSNPEDPENWLECNGQTISQSVYPELHALVGSRTPDYRGEFLRGLDLGRGIDKNRVVGSGQAGAAHINGSVTFVGATKNIMIRSATGDFSVTSGGHYGMKNRLETGNAQPAQTLTVTSDPNQPETRPRNISVRYLIRAK